MVIEINIIRKNLLKEFMYFMEGDGYCFEGVNFKVIFAVTEKYSKSDRTEQ
jgi:hypothetical protein